MRYADYDNQVSTIEDLEKYKRYFEKDIANKQKELSDFIDRANKRLKWVKECEENNNYRILGSAFKSGRKKEIMFIIRYPDGTQREERYSFDKIAEMRKKLHELEEEYSNVDWSDFRYEV